MASRRLCLISRHLATARVKDASVSSPATVQSHGGEVLSLTLNAPRSRNALSLAMVERLSQALVEQPLHRVTLLQGAEGNFCAGGDVKSIALAIERDLEDGVRQGMHFFEQEDTLIYNLSRLPLLVSLWDGFVMGGGVGISLVGRYRVCGPRTRFAMPETAIGLFPDVASTRVLSALGAAGTYIALTGVMVGPQDCVHLGLATHYVHDMRKLEAALCSLAPDECVDTLLARMSSVPPLDPNFDSSIRKHSALIERCFSSDSIEEILSRLTRESDPFAASIRTSLLNKSPTSLRASLLSLQDVPSDLQQLLNRDLNFCQRLIRFPDFARGVRAVLVDKAPVSHWEPVASDWRTWNECVRPPFTPQLAFDGSPSVPKLFHRQIFNAWQDFPNFACHGCAPGDASLGLVFVVPSESTSYDVSCHHFVEATSFPQVAHGGLLAMLVDESAYFAFNAKHQAVGLTSQLETKYLRPVRPRAFVQVFAQVKQSSLQHAEVEVIITQHGKKCVVGKVKYTIPPRALAARALACAPEDLDGFLAEK